MTRFYINANQLEDLEKLAKYLMKHSESEQVKEAAKGVDDILFIVAAQKLINVKNKESAKYRVSEF